MHVPRLSLLLIGGGTLALGSCQGNTTGPAVGSILVATNTTGSDLDANGYTVTVNDGDPEPIGVVDTIHVDGLPPDIYQVSLGGLATNCSTEAGAHLREASVTAGDTVAVNFVVTCEARPGGGDPVP